MATNFQCQQAIVVGGGLAGMSAANTLLENGASVVLLDKSSFCGGNSTKATSGINGAETKTQKEKGIPDTKKLFVDDTLKGGAKKPDVVKVLCENSGADVDWLMDKFKLDLSLVARLGGHSQPRTHRGKERFPGMTITYALIQMVEQIGECRPDKARIITKATVTELIAEAGKVLGCVYTKNGATFKEFGPVIFCSGGFGADFTEDSLLAQHRPDLLHLPTTNGEHCTGDAIKMGMKIGAKSIDLEWVQVHPTGLVKPDDADAKIKFLAAEALRGVGGLILDKNGKRIANELGRRDYVTGEMWKGKPPFRLALNKAASDEILWHCKHYTGRGVMKAYASGADLAKDMGVELSVLVKTHQDHYEASEKQAKDPEGASGKWAAYPSGKTYDEASGVTGSGKKFYHNVIQGSAVEKEPFFVAIITPVIHYCMGGLEINAASEVIGKDSKPVPGLYAAGEVAGGVHGSNRLGGNSLLDCVVFGRVSGLNAAKYMLGADVTPTSLAELSKGGVSGGVKKASLAGGSYEDDMNAGSAKKAAAPAAQKGGAPAAAGFVMGDVAKHNSKESCWVVVNNQVLDVTNFLKDHPGGELAILTFAGRDATEEFNMIHPPDVIPKYAPNAIIGMLGAGGGQEVAEAAAGGGAATPLLAGGKKAKDWTRNKKNWNDRMKGDGKIPGWLGAICYMVLGFMKEIVFTIFGQKNISLTGDRVGLTRSAMFLFVFIIIHAIGNLHVFLGPDDFNGYGYFYVRLYCTGFGLDANIVEEYVLLAALLHVFVALKRTGDISINYKVSDGKMNLAFSGISLLTFMMIHLYQFRFGDAAAYVLCPPPYLVNVQGLFTLNLFWVYYEGCYRASVRDIYALEFDVFASPGWVMFYLSSVTIFCVHMCLGWQKVVPSPILDIPKRYQAKAIHWGYIMTAFIAMIYMSFPLYTHLFSMKQGFLKACGAACKA